MNGYLLGLDIGGTKTEAALIAISEVEKPMALSDITPDSFPIPPEFLKSAKNLSGKVIARSRIPTNGNGTYEELLDNYENLCTTIVKEGKIEFSDLIGIGAGLPGTVHPKEQMMLNGNTRLFVGKKLASDLSARLPGNPKVILENDATCFALAEAFCGAGQHFLMESGKPISEQIGIGIILGTGVGGGIIIRGHQLSGANGGGGELGHTVLHPEGRSCYCGSKGCSESYLSGTAVEKRYKEITGEEKKGQDIFDQVKTDPNCQQVVSEYLQDLNRFLVKMTNIFDPDYFVFGGGVSKRDELYTEAVEKQLADEAFVPASAPKIYKHLLGDSAGVVGAALLNLVS